MTTYLLGSEVYARELRRRINQLQDVASVVGDIRKLRREAQRERTEARSLGFQAPYVGYIPAYGTDEQLRAMIDYCRLKRIADRSESFAEFVTTSVLCPMRRGCEGAARRTFGGI